MGFEPDVNKLKYLLLIKIIFIEKINKYYLTYTVLFFILPLGFSLLASNAPKK